MTDGDPKGAGRFEVRPTVDTHFGWLRTRLSVERTLMSWVRTGIALIGFGFTIVQIFERLNASPGVTPPAFPEAPRYFGLALIGAGTIGLAIALWEYLWILSYLWRKEYAAVAGVGDRWNTPVLGITILLILIGLAAFAAVLLRV